MIASLPWYDFDSLRTATDAFWAGLAGHLRHRGVRDVPNLLDRTPDYEAPWRSPDLLFSQSCGYDLAIPYRRQLKPVATPCYDVPD